MNKLRPCVRRTRKAVIQIDISDADTQQFEKEGFEDVKCSLANDNYFEKSLR